MASEISAEQVACEVLYWLKLADLDRLVGFCEEYRIDIPDKKKGNKSLKGKYHGQKII